MLLKYTFFPEWSNISKMVHQKKIKLLVRSLSLSLTCECLHILIFIFHFILCSLPLSLCHTHTHILSFSLSLSLPPSLCISHSHFICHLISCLKNLWCVTQKNALKRVIECGIKFHLNQNFIWINLMHELESVSTWKDKKKSNLKS